MDAELKKKVETLLRKAADATNAAEAMSYSQAACNSANALRVLAEIETRYDNKVEG
jgi:hypothetical protein